jgi:bifunctional DNase/RNase
MYVKTEYLSKIRQNNIDTYYIYSKQEKIILPLDIPIGSSVYPKTSDSIRRILAVFSAKISLVKVYGERNETFYTYLQLYQTGKSYDINICLRDAIQLAESIKCPIYVKKTVLLNSGIRVTKKLLEEALG